MIPDLLKDCPKPFSTRQRRIYCIFLNPPIALVERNARLFLGPEIDLPIRVLASTRLLSF